MKHLFVFFFIIMGLSALDYHGVALAPDNLTGWAVCIDTALIFNTTDGGITWQNQNTPDTLTKRFFDITCTDQLNAWTCGILGEILHTDNGGFDWYGQAIGLSKYATRIEFLDQNYGWVACGDGTIARTTDGGSFWEQNFTPWYSDEYYGISSLNQWDCWAVAGYPDSMAPAQGIIIYSSDGGVNWDSLYRNPGFEDYLDLHFFNLFDGIVVGGDESDTSALILKTSDGGTNWNYITPPANAYYLRALDFVANHGWAVGRFGTIIYTSDGGDTWIFQNNPATTTLFDVDFSDSLHGLACGYDIILYTTDGGQHWNETGVLENNNYSLSRNQLTIYPNPTHKELNLFYPTATLDNDVKLHIYDAAGRVVHNIQSNSSANKKRIKWHIKFNLPAGIYFIQLQSDAQSITRKFLVDN